MRTITLRYPGDCRKCGAPLLVGAVAVYERRVGIFCPACAPTSTDEIREYREEGAEHRAGKLEGWAAKREEKAAAVFAANERFTGDVAFNTQPGHIPFRARIIRQEDRQFESLALAREMRAKAARLRYVTVAGDAEREREARREATRAWIRPDMLVNSPLYGPGLKVLTVNRKTATLAGQFGPVKDGLHWLTPANPVAASVSG